MNKIRAGFDLDDVIFNTTPEIFKNLSKIYGELDINNVHEYGIHKCLNLNPEIVYQSIYYTIASTDFELHENCFDVINELKQKYELYFITSRNSRLENMTVSNIHKKLSSQFYLYDLSGLIFTDDKTKYIKDLNLKYFIDDRAKTLEDVKATTDCTPICFDKPWNQRLTDYLRVSNWNDIKNLLLL